MTLDEFAATTLRVIARDGFDDYLPTAYFPGRCHIAVLEEIPEDVDIERVSLRWAEERAIADEEFLVAFKTDCEHFKVIHRSGQNFEQATYSVNAT